MAYQMYIYIYLNHVIRLILESRILLGSVQRGELIRLLDEMLSPARRSAYFKDMAVRFTNSAQAPEVTITPPTPHVADDVRSSILMCCIFYF